VIRQRHLADADHLRARATERHRGEEVAGILDDHGVARIDQCPRDQIEGLLRAARHQHLVGVSRDAASRELTRNRSTQLGFAERVEVIGAIAQAAVERNEILLSVLTGPESRTLDFVVEQLTKNALGLLDDQRASAVG